MRTRFSVFIVIFGGFVGQFSLIKTISAELCGDICECSPNNSEPTLVNCRLNDTELDLTHDLAKTLLRTETLNIYGSDFLSLPPDGLPELKNLKTLEFKAIESLSLPLIAFPNLNSLIIERIDRLYLDKFKLPNSLTNIEVRRSSVKSIKSDSFKMITDLKKLSFVDTSIVEILPRSINLATSASRSLLLQFINCKIGNISSNGIFASVSKLKLQNTTFDATIHNNGIRVNAMESVEISGCKFSNGSLRSGSLKLRSPVVNITGGNEFVAIPNKLLDVVSVSVSVSGGGGKKQLFIDDLKRDVDLKGGFKLDDRGDGSTNVTTDKLYFTGNKIACDCNAVGILRRYKDDSVFLEDNLCENHHHERIRVSDFIKKQLLLLNGSECDFHQSLSDLSMTTELRRAAIEIAETTMEDDNNDEASDGTVVVACRDIRVMVCVLILYIFISQ